MLVRLDCNVVFLLVMSPRNDVLDFSTRITLNMISICATPFIRSFPGGFLVRPRRVAHDKRAESHITRENLVCIKTLSH